MIKGETPYELAARDVAAQKARILAQEATIDRLKGIGASVELAEVLLQEMKITLAVLQAKAERLKSN